MKKLLFLFCGYLAAQDPFSGPTFLYHDKGKSLFELTVPQLPCEKGPPMVCPNWDRTKTYTSEATWIFYFGDGVAYKLNGVQLELAVRARGTKQ